MKITSINGWDKLGAAVNIKIIPNFLQSHDVYNFKKED